MLKMKSVRKKNLRLSHVETLWNAVLKLRKQLEEVRRPTRAGKDTAAFFE
jgi:hypothetical protein